MAPFALSPLNLHFGYWFKGLWDRGVEEAALAALLLSIATGVFGVFLLFRRRLWRVLATLVVVPAYGVLWFGNQLYYGCELFRSCL